MARNLVGGQLSLKNGAFPGVSHPGKQNIGQGSGGESNSALESPLLNRRLLAPLGTYMTQITYKMHIAYTRHKRQNRHTHTPTPRTTKTTNDTHTQMIHAMHNCMLS